MAGSYDHVVDHQGRLISPTDMAQVLDTGGDVYETVEEMFGMIWWLADQMTGETGVPAQSWVESARTNSEYGIFEASPGRAEDA